MKISVKFLNKEGQALEYLRIKFAKVIEANDKGGFLLANRYDKWILQDVHLRQSVLFCDGKTIGEMKMCMFAKYC